MLSKKYILRNLSFLLLVGTLTFTNASLTSCSPKSGCKINEGGARTNRKGELSQKRGKTNLLPKKYRKKSR